MAVIGERQIAGGNARNLRAKTSSLIPFRGCAENVGLMLGGLRLIHLLPFYCPKFTLF
jgi:hypothetical protein